MRADDKRTDVELVQCIRSGDRNAFDALYLRYHSALWRHAYRYVRSSEIADELVQDVFLAIWKRREDWQVREGADKYLHTAVRNAALKHLRREMFAPQPGEERDIATGEIHSYNDRDIDEQIDANDLDHALAQAINNMPEARRRVVQLRFGREMSYAEIAEVLGISVEAATIQVARAREALKKVRDNFEHS